MSFFERYINLEVQSLNLQKRIFSQGTLVQNWVFFWLLLQQLALILVFYFVFSVGFKARGPYGLEFMPWFITALVPWTFISGGLISVTNSITRNIFIVKKTPYPSQFLPIISIISELYVQMIFIAVLLVFLISYGFTINIQSLVIVKYIVFAALVVFGFGFFTSAMNVYSTDIGHALSIFLNLMFWMTPIVWDLTMIPDQYHWVALINPMFYVVNGYRECLLPMEQEPIYSWTSELLMFGAMLFILAGGLKFFKRSKNHFSDISK